MPEEHWTLDDFERVTTTDPATINKVIVGMEKLADTMQVTLGPYGRNVLIQKRNKIMTTKDGFTVASHATTLDIYENIGLALLREISLATNFNVGDGTTTAALLARYIVKQGMERIKAGENSVVVAEEIKASSIQILNEIDKLKRDIANNEDIAHIATIASGYPEIGEIISKIYEKQGKDCRIVVQRSKTDKTEIENVQGLKIDRTYILPFFINSDHNMAIIENASVLIIEKDNVVNQEFFNAVNRILETTHRKELVIFARNLSEDSINFLFTNKTQKKLNPIVLGIPDNVKDIELITGAKSLSGRSTQSLQNFQVNMVGFAQKVVCNNKYTTLIGNPNCDSLVSKEIERLKILNEKNEINHEDSLRLANLSGGIGVLKLGKITDLGWEEMNYRVEDAIRATETAVKYGIIEGEFQGLLKACKNESFFKEIVYKLMKILCDNGGFEEKIWKRMCEGKGYDFKNKVFVDDLYQAGIIDPVEVTRASLKNAVNVAAIFLTTSGLVVDAYKIEKGA